MSDAELAEVEALATCHGCGGVSDDSDDSVGDLVPCEWCEPTRMLCSDCAHDFDDEPEHGTTLNGCGECWERSRAVMAEERVAVLERALRDLVGALQSQAASWQIVATDVAREVGGVLSFAEPHIKQHLATMAALRLDEIHSALLNLTDTKGSGSR